MNRRDFFKFVVAFSLFPSLPGQDGGIASNPSLAMLRLHNITEDQWRRAMASSPRWRDPLILSLEEERLPVYLEGHDAEIWFSPDLSANPPIWERVS